MLYSIKAHLEQLEKAQNHGRFMTYSVNVNGAEFITEICRYGANKFLRVNGEPVSFDFATVKLDGDAIEFDMNGKHHVCKIKRNSGELTIECAGKDFSVEVKCETATAVMAGTKPSFKESIHSPMPGLVRTLRAKEGDAVVRGEPLLILEAMKMENEIRSPVFGTINKLYVSSGSRVEKGDILATIEGSSAL